MTWLNGAPPASVFRVELDPEEIRIEKGVPMPERKSGGRPNVGEGAVKMYPWEQMERGDSFLALPIHNQNTVRAAAWTVGCRLNRDFSTRQMPDGRIRVWRTR